MSKKTTLYFLHALETNDPVVEGGYFTLTFKSYQEAESARLIMHAQNNDMDTFITRQEHWEISYE